MDPYVDKALVMGGFLGQAEEWEKASDAWEKCLHESPEIEYFSHKEAQSLSGQFGRFSREGRDRKVLSLANVISAFMLQGFCVSVPYQSFVRRDRDATKGIVGTRAYDWGFLTATSGVLTFVQDTLKATEKVDFIFDERQELKACIGMWSLMIQHGIRPNAGQCVPGDDKEIAALQMADLLAWEFQRRMQVTSTVRHSVSYRLQIPFCMLRIRLRQI
jgi:hypothetical protein